MQQTRTEIRRQIERARSGGYLSTLAFYIHIQVPPSLRIDNIKEGPYQHPLTWVPLIPLTGSFEPVKQYDYCKLQEMEELADAFVLLCSWKWQNLGLRFFRCLTSLETLKNTKTLFYNALTDMYDEVCISCGEVNKKYLFVYREGGYKCSTCTPLLSNFA